MKAMILRSVAAVAVRRCKNSSLRLHRRGGGGDGGGGGRMHPLMARVDVRVR